MSKPSPRSSDSNKPSTPPSFTKPNKGPLKSGMLQNMKLNAKSSRGNPAAKRRP